MPNPMDSLTTANILDAAISGGMVVALLLLLLVLLALPGMLRGTAEPHDILAAATAELLKLVGIAMLAVGAVPTALSVLQKSQFAAGTYLSLLCTFLAGGILFVVQDARLNAMSSAARSAPAAISRGLLLIIGWLASTTGIVLLVRGFALALPLSGGAVAALAGFLLLLALQQHAHHASPVRSQPVRRMLIAKGAKVRKK